TFTFNTLGPTVTVNYPVNGNYYSAVAVDVATPIAGVTTSPGTNPPSVSTVTISMQDNGGNYLTSGGTFGSGSLVKLGAQGSTTSWNYNNAALTLTNDHQYTVSAYALDF